MTLLYIKLGLGLALLIIAGSFYAGAKYGRKLEQDAQLARKYVDLVKAEIKQTVEKEL